MTLYYIINFIIQANAKTVCIYLNEFKTIFYNIIIKQVIIKKLIMKF